METCVRSAFEEMVKKYFSETPRDILGKIDIELCSNISQRFEELIPNEHARLKSTMMRQFDPKLLSALVFPVSLRTGNCTVLLDRTYAERYTGSTAMLSDLCAIETYLRFCRYADIWEMTEFVRDRRYSNVRLLNNLYTHFQMEQFFWDRLSGMLYDMEESELKAKLMEDKLPQLKQMLAERLAKHKNDFDFMAGVMHYMGSFFAYYKMERRHLSQDDLCSELFPDCLNDRLNEFLNFLRKHPTLEGVLDHETQWNALLDEILRSIRKEEAAF